MKARARNSADEVSGRQQMGAILRTTDQGMLDEAHQRLEQSQQIEHALPQQMHFTALTLLLRDEGMVARILRENNRFNNTLAQLEGAATRSER